MSYWLCSPEDELILFSGLKTVPYLPISNYLLCWTRFCLTWLWASTALSFFHFIRHVGLPLFFELAEPLPASRPLHLLVPHLPQIFQWLSFWQSTIKGFPGGSEGEVSDCNPGDLGSAPGLGKSPGEGNANPLQYSCLGNSMDGGAWWARVHEIPKSQSTIGSMLFERPPWPPLWEVYLSFSYFLSYQPLLNPHIAHHTTHTRHRMYTVSPRDQLLSQVWLLVTPWTALPGFSVHGISQARMLDWVSTSSSRASSWPRNQTCVSYVSCTGWWILYHWAPWEAQVSMYIYLLLLFIVCLVPWL